MRRLVKRTLLVLIASAVAILIGFAFRPKPIIVEVGTVTRGPLQVTIDEDGETRAHDRFTLAAPISGRLSRIEFHEGDEVGPQTTLATISPLPLDARELAEIRARIRSAEARKQEADELLARWRNEHEQTTRDLNRARLLAKNEIMPQQALEQAESKQTSAAKEVEAAKFRVRSAVADLQREQAGLVSLERQGGSAGRLVAIRPPVRCQILRILEKSERVVSFGTPLVVLSNPSKIEIVVDLLSTDAVNVKAGDPVVIENWGGSRPLAARVRTVEPYGFTKVSALGIEEQRVNVIADFLDSSDGLGDGYRIDARIVIWENPSVLKVPAGALFRVAKQWSAFIIQNGRAHRVPVEIGHRNATDAEVIEGLHDGTHVILYPGNDVRDNARVTFHGHR